MFKMVRVLIYRSNKRANQKGFAPLWCRITMGTLETEFSTGISVLEDEWDSERKKILGESDVATVHNAWLDQLRAKIHAIQLDRHLKGQPLSPVVIRNILLNNQNGTLFTKFLEDWFTQILPEKKFASSTVVKYSNYKENIIQFLQENKISSLLINEFNAPLAEKLRSWLYKELLCTRSHCSRHLRLCREVLSYAVRCGHLEHNTLREIQMDRDPDREIIALTIEEIKKINKYKFVSLTLTSAWHLFLFQCYSGLSYGDLWAFEIRTDTEGINWIYSSKGRIKNGNFYIVPLFSPAKQILDLYNGKLPYFTNQAYNRFLKEIAGIVGIDKYLTTHVARKTFATLKDEEGFELSTIARMMGNTESVLRKHYITGSEKRIVEEMTRLRIVV